MHIGAQQCGKEGFADSSGEARVELCHPQLTAHSFAYSERQRALLRGNPSSSSDVFC